MDHLESETDGRTHLTEIYVDDNLDINYLTRTVSQALRKRLPGHERVVVSINMEAVDLNLRK